MASDKSVDRQIEILNLYLKEKTITPNTIKVLKQVGDFAYILKFPQFNEFSVTLTLQITENQPISNANLILSFSKEVEKSDKAAVLSEKIKSFLAAANNEDSLLTFFIETFNLINAELPKPKEQIVKQKAKKEKPVEKNENSQNDNQNSKKCSMKTAADVVNRIQWDSQIDKDHIIVGYLDRFLGIKECLFNKFDWGDIVLADLGALAIPEHRICYFKYKNEVVWDKSQRLDNIFGSTGSKVTIYDVINKLEKVDYVPVFEEEIEVNKVGRAQPQKKESETPNYFLSIPISDAEVRENFRKIKSILIEDNNEVERMILPEESLHLTLCTLRIDGKEEKENVCRLLEEISKRQKFLANFPIEIAFQGVGSFYDKVFFIDSKAKIEQLKVVKEFVLDEFKKANINIAGNYYDFVPHLTVFKISKKSIENHEMATVSQFVSRSIFEKFKNFNFGGQNVREIHLCKMVDIFSCLTYPVEYTLKIE